MLALSAFAPSVQAASVTPTPISSGNPTCGDFNAGWTQLKVEPPGNGTFTDGTLEVTITNFVNSSSGEPGSFDWASNIGVDAVFVKAGSDKHNLYVYNPESTGDTDLGPQAGTGNGISHISFCYDEDAVPSAPPSTPPSEAPSAPPSEAPSTPPSEAPSTPPSTPPSAPPSAQPTGSELPASSEGPSVAPSGQVGGIVGTPGVTPPSTDAIGQAGSATSESWRIVLAGLAGLIAALLLFTQPTRAKVRAR
jgi:hypothetical protein